MISTIAIILQLAASLLSGANAAHNPQTVATAAQAVQLSTQALALANVNFAVPQNATIWPNISGLQAAPYIDARGGYVQLGTGVRLNTATVSFGDLNGDGYDDAVVVVKRMHADGSSSNDLAAMLNQGGILFNIADTPLGNNVQFASHQIKNGELWLDNTRYVLWGNQLIKR